MKNDSMYFCSLKELNEKKYIIKFFDTIKNELIIFKDKFQKIKIFSSICPHFGGEIFFNVNQRKLQCKWHGWKFCAETGKCENFPIRTKLDQYEFKIENNNIYVLIND